MLAMLVTVGLSSVAAADPTPAPDVHKMNSNDCAQARKQNKTCVLSIEEEAVDGKVPTLTETSVVVNPFGKHGSLISLRRDFIPEILKSAEDL